MKQEDFTHALHWAITTGEKEQVATSFAEYYSATIVELQREEPEEIDKNKKVAWTWALEFLEKYKDKRALGHSSQWSYAYAASYEEEEPQREDDAYSTLKTRASTLDEANSLVEQEAYTSRLAKGEVYAKAYAKYILDGEFATADKYASLLTHEVETGKRLLYADQYAGLVVDDYAPAYARHYATMYEQASMRDMPAFCLHLYADRVAEKLFEYATTPEDRDYYIVEADGYIAGYQYGKENNYHDVEWLASTTAQHYVNALAQDGILKQGVEIRQQALKDSLHKALEQNTRRHNKGLD